MKYCLVLAVLLVQLLAKSQEPKMLVPIGHTGYITALSYSNNGKFVASSSVDNTAKIWDIKTGTLLKTLTSHTQAVKHIVFSSNDKLLATASDDATAIIWNAENGDKLFTLKGHFYTVCYLQFSHNNKLLATASWDGTTKIWDTNTGKLIHTLKAHDEKVVKVLFSANDEFIYTASEDNTCIIWYVNTGKALNTLKGHQHAITDIALNTSAKQLATTSIDKTFKIWNIETAKLIVSYETPSKAEYSSFETVNYSSNGELLAATTNDGVIVLWHVKSNKLFKTIQTNSKEIRYAAFCNNNKQVITYGTSSKIQIWDIATEINISSVNHDKTVTTALIDSKNNILYSSSADNTIKVTNILNGTLLSEFKNYVDAPYYSKAVFSNDGKSVFLPSNQGTARSWNICTAATEWAKISHKNAIRHVALSSSGNYVAMSSEIEAIATSDTTVHVYNTLNGALLYSFKGSPYFNTPLSFSNKENILAYSNASGTVCLVDVTTGKTIKTIKLGNGYVVSVAFSKEDDYLEVKLRDVNDASVVYNFKDNKAVAINKRFITTENSPQLNKQSKRVLHTFNYNRVFVCNPFTGDTLLKLQGHKGEITKVIFSEDEKMLATVCKDSIVRLFNLTDGKLMYQWNNIYSDYDLVGIKFLNKDNLLLIAVDSLLLVHDVQKGKKTKEITNTSSFGNIVFGNNYLLNTSSDGSFQLWDINKFSLLYSFVLFNGLDYLAQEASGYYKATSNAAKKLHYVTKDFKVVSFEQLDLQYNRPDKVLEFVDCADSAMIKSYVQAYVKRIVRQGIDTTVFKKSYVVPEVEIVQATKGVQEQLSGTFKLKVVGASRQFNIHNFNVWVNDVPIFGFKGIKYTSQNKFKIDTIISIQLSAGDNRIEASLINSNGLESYRFPLYIKHKPQVIQQPTVHFIGIGINQFANADYNLNWSVKDIRDLAAKLKEKYPNLIIDTLFDKQVIHRNITDLKKKLLKLTVNDKVIISYSGHGVLNKTFNYFLSTYNIDFTNPEENGLAYETMENLLDNIPPRKKLMLIDACHSGEVDKEEIAKIEAAKSTLNNNGVTTKSTIKVVPKKNLGMTNSFELMQNLFVNVGKGTGATIISAAGGMQYAQERGDLKNGVFTYSLIEAFNQNTTLKVSELKKKVGERVTQLTNGLQKPTSRNETNNYDWVIW